MDRRPPPAESLPNRGALLRRLPLAVLALAALAGAVLLRGQIDFAALAAARESLLAFRDAHYAAAAAGFVLAYAALVACSLPGATVASLTGGFLFGLFPGVLFNVAAAATGAVILFSAARAGIGADVARRIAGAGGRGARLMAALRANEWSVLLVMRLVPAVPFFLANLLPAFAGVRTHRFVVTTVVGIVPGALVYTSVGRGLGEVFARGGAAPDPAILFAPAVLGPLLGLAVLAALPILLRRQAAGGRDGSD